MQPIIDRVAMRQVINCFGIHSLIARTRDAAELLKEFVDDQRMTRCSFAEWIEGQLIIERADMNNAYFGNGQTFNNGHAVAEAEFIIDRHIAYIEAELRRNGFEWRNMNR